MARLTAKLTLWRESPVRKPMMKIDKNLEFLVNIINQKLFKFQNHTLNNAEITILRGIWKSQTYNQIAKEKGYSYDYLANVVAPKLFLRLSDLAGQRITKKNCRILIESYAAKQILPKTTLPSKVSDKFVSNVNQNTSPCYPNGSVPLNSYFYIKRSNTEEKLYEEVCKPGAFMRIKAPKEMGKTSLVLRILDYANRRDYCTVSLNLEQMEQTILRDLNQFLRCLCANISYQLNLEPQLDEYWNDDVGSKVSCTLYLQNYILKQIDSPLVLVLDDLHHIFEYSSVTKDFLLLLRSWNEEAKKSSILQKLRLVVSYSTEIYIPLKINQSSFNVGLPIKLESFDIERILQLAQCYKLDWIDDKKAEQLMNKIGGHPALVNIAFYHLYCGEISFEQLLKDIFNPTGIYAHHLQRHWITLQKQPELLFALNTIMNTNKPVKLEPILANRLSSLGLIELSESKVIPSCELYKRYFTDIDRERMGAGLDLALLNREWIC